jgi:hypothetical protein
MIALASTWQCIFLWGKIKCLFDRHLTQNGQALCTLLSMATCKPHETILVEWSLDGTDPFPRKYEVNGCDLACHLCAMSFTCADQRSRTGLSPWFGDLGKR